MLAQRGCAIRATLMALALTSGCSGDDASVERAQGDAGTDAGPGGVPPWAAPGGEAENRDGPPAFGGMIRNEPDDRSNYVFDDGELRTYDLTLGEEELAQLDGDPRAEVYVPGRLGFEGHDVGPVGVRYKGSVGAFIGCVDSTTGEKTCTKISMKVKINWEDPEARFYGLRKLQFHAMNRDASMMKERLGYWVFRQAGIAAPRVVHVRLRINGQLQGVYALVEQIDGSFTRSRFVEGGKGNLYKEAWPLDADGAPVTEETLTEALRTNEDENPSFDQMLELADALASTPVTEVPDVFSEYMDTDYLMQYVAVDRAIRHDDGPFHWYCSGQNGCYSHNFYIYEESDAARFWIVAWDLDSAFNVDNRTTTMWFEWDDTTLGCMPVSRRPFVLPQRAPYCDPAQHGMTLFQQRYVDATRALLQGPLRREVLEERLLEWEQQIYPAVLEAAEAHGDAPTFEAWQQGRAWLRASLDRLLEQARARVERGPLPRSVLALDPVDADGGMP